MKKLLSALLMLALCFTLAHAESDTRIILFTVYQQMGWGDRVEIGCVDEKGSLWTLNGSASKLNWPYGVEEQLEFLRTTRLKDRAGKLDSDELFDLKSLVYSAEPMDVKPVPAANDAGTETSWAVTYDRDGNAKPVKLATSGDDVYENTSPDAQALYVYLRQLFPKVTCYGGTMGPAGFSPVPVYEFLKLDPVQIRASVITASVIDCEAGPIAVEDPDESIIDFVLESAVTGKANATMVTGGTTVYGFYDAGGAYIGSIELYRGLLVTSDGMYYIGK